MSSNFSYSRHDFDGSNSSFSEDSNDRSSKQMCPLPYRPGKKKFSSAADYPVKYGKAFVSTIVCLSLLIPRNR